MPARTALLLLSALLTPPGAVVAQSGGFSWSERYGKSPTQFTPDDWAPIVDAAWGAGKSTDAKLGVFDRWYEEIEQRFGGFHGLDAPWHVRVDLYDTLGRRVTTLMDAPAAAGSHRVAWDGRGSGVGPYVWRLRAGAETSAGTLVRVR